MPPKRLKQLMSGEVVSAEIASTYKATPKPYEGFRIYKHIAERELSINDNTANEYFKEHYNMTRDEFAALSPADQLKAIGVKSAPKAKIYTEAEDKAKRDSRFAEDTAVNKVFKWFKVDYPGIPFNIDKVAQKRSKIAGMIHKGAAFQSGHPDIHIPVARGGFNALYIEQKVSDDIFYQNTRILKPGSENRHIWQSLYHTSLREQGNWVMFSISEDATKKIIARYMSGNPYPQQVFPYYCKPEDYAMFGGNEHFKPVKERP